MLIFASVTYTVLVMIDCFVCSNEMVTPYIILERNEPYLVIGINSHARTHHPAEALYYTEQGSILQ